MTVGDVLRDRAEPMARIGLATRGGLYCVAGALALLVASGRGDGEVEGQGALEAVAGEPYGRPLLLVLAAGLAAYALWRLLRALTGAREGSDGDGWEGLAQRVHDVGSAAVYVSLVAAAIRLLTRTSAGTDNDQQARSLSARLLEHGWGQAVVVVAGLVLLGVGLALAWWGLSHRFEDHLRTSSMGPIQRRWLPRLGVLGHTARGVVAALVGAFLVQAALEHDPTEAVGIDGALRRLADRPYGTPMLVVVAAGLVAYGLYSLVEARWRRVLED